MHTGSRPYRPLLFPCTMAPIVVSDTTCRAQPPQPKHWDKDYHGRLRQICCVPKLLCLLDDSFLTDAFFRTTKKKKWKPTSGAKYPVLSSLVCAGVRTALLLQHPDLQLDEAVGVEAVVLPDAAVATLVAADVQLVHGTHRPDLGVAHQALLENVNQAPDGHTHRIVLIQLLGPTSRGCERTHLWFSKLCLVTGCEQKEGSSLLVLLMILGLWSKHTCTTNSLVRTFQHCAAESLAVTSKMVTGFCDACRRVFSLWTGSAICSLLHPIMMCYSFCKVEFNFSK